MESHPRRLEHILIAVDDSGDSQRAVLYVGELLGAYDGFHATLLNILQEIPEDYFEEKSSRVHSAEQQREKALKRLESYRSWLISAGFRQERVSVRLEVMDCATVAECIMSVQKRLSCRTLVLGRHGMSRREERLFGSTTDKLLHEARDVVLWIVE